MPSKSEPQPEKQDKADPKRPALATKSAPEKKQGEANPAAVATAEKTARSSTEELIRVSEEHTNVGGPPRAVFTKWCKGCGICIAFCPKGVLAADEDGQPQVVAPEKCTGCRMCELRCPDFAIRAVGGRKRGHRNG